MSTATTTRPSPQTPWTSHPQSRAHQKPPSTTPLNLPTRIPGSAGQSLSPRLSAGLRSPSKQHDMRTSSPGYFGFAVEPGGHAVDPKDSGHTKTNWTPPDSTKARSAGLKSPKFVPLDYNAEFEAFRRQSETNPFTLSHGNFSAHLPGTSSATRTTSAKHQATSPEFYSEDKPQGKKPALDSVSMGVDRPLVPKGSSQSNSVDRASILDIPRNESPANLSSLDLPKAPSCPPDDRHARLSLPQNSVGGSSTISQTQSSRASTLPASLNRGPGMIDPEDLASLISDCVAQDILFLDLRVTPQYSNSRIIGAINLCLPTTLIKRPSFNLQRLADTFTRQEDKQKFLHWTDAKYIVAYDSSSAQLKDAASPINTLKKFGNEGWHGTTYVIRGGFVSFSTKFPHLVDSAPAAGTQDPNQSQLSIDPQAAGIAPVAGGCPMPTAKTAANPFFGNIRQNMDLIGGVGQMPLKRPEVLTDKSMSELPTWLREASDKGDNGRTVSDRFLNIEKTEQQRMQKALSGHVSYGSPLPSTVAPVQIAGIEKGTKNRYKDMLPFDHSRVRLQNVPTGECDYVNASHIKAKHSNRHYIATQAPVPATFEDFWRVVWEQNARVIVMLTAESEGGQRKSHPYWLTGRYGPFNVQSVSEKEISLDSLDLPINHKAAPTRLKSPKPDRPGIGQRRSTNPISFIEKENLRDQAQSPHVPAPFLILRSVTLSSNSHSSEPTREITQVHYSNWPDFGVPLHPAHLVALVELCSTIVQSSNGEQTMNANAPAKEGERPIVVHCSAGCGRTGTFCTVDTVLDMLKRQRLDDQASGAEGQGDKMDIDENGDWINRDDVDLVAETVEDFRAQRLSMVQSLRQFVLCYESVLEWMVQVSPAKFNREGLRRSYQG